MIIRLSFISVIVNYLLLLDTLWCLWIEPSISIALVNIQPFSEENPIKFVLCTLVLSISFTKHIIVEGHLSVCSYTVP